MAADIKLEDQPGVTWVGRPREATEDWATSVVQRTGELAYPCSRRGVLRFDTPEETQTVVISMTVTNLNKWVYLLGGISSIGNGAF